MKTALFVLILCIMTVQLHGQYSLDSCKKLALKNNAVVNNSMLDLQSAEKTKQAAFTKYFPEVSATGMAFRSNSSIVDLDANDADLDVTFENQTINDVIQTLYANYGYLIPGATVNIQMIDHGGYITANQCTGLT